MIIEKFPDLAELSREEQMILSTELWEKNISSEIDPGVNEVILEFLKESHKRYLENPDDVITHEELKKKYGRSKS